MIAENTEVKGRCCKLLMPIRDHEGHMHFGETPHILREMENLGRRMFLVQFDDGATTFVFPQEADLCEPVANNN